MENQHRKISGYRELNAGEIEMMNDIKSNANQLGELLEMLNQADGIDKRALAIAKTELQTGFMWLIRAIAKPDGF